MNIALSQAWKLTAESVAQEMETSISSGLSSAEAESRRKQYGLNVLTKKKGSGPWHIFLSQFHDFMIWVLMGAAIVSGIIGEWIDTTAIVCIVILNAILGFVQEYRAEKALSALKKLSSPSSKVVRNGERLLVPSAELVPGDLVEMEAGDHIPADCRVCSQTAGFTVQEASLTGESEPVNKQSASLDKETLPLAEQYNMLFMGTAVLSGRATGIVLATGMKTELGHIADMIQDVGHETTPLQKKLAEFGRIIVRVCFVLVAAVFAIGLIRGGNPIALFLTSVSLAVAAIPEGLPAVVTIALALGVQRMVKRNALIRKLPSVETLGCASVICSDKTGTLTRNEMTVRAIFAGSEEIELTGTGYAPTGIFLRNGSPLSAPFPQALTQCLTASIICNAASLSEKNGVFQIIGDPTEGALLTAAAKAGLDKNTIGRSFPHVEELPFDSDRKMMSVIRNDPAGGFLVLTKGAPEVLIERCTRILNPDGTEHALRGEDRSRIIEINTGWAGKALRVLAVARRSLLALPDSISSENLETGMTFLGLIAMSDPPRPEARVAVELCRTAGIRPVMITGDNRFTAAAVGRELTLLAENAEVVTGEELNAWDDSELERRVEQISVYARVSPEHKLRIIRAWRKRGQIVAMTGDGVNDAPAIKEADIGVAMGITGTDVTKEVADMIVLDDNFASIVSAVEEGRGVYDNIQKFIHYLLSCNIGEVLVMFLASLAGMPMPLLPIHILWVNLVTDGFPALALGVDPIDKDVMRRPPRNPSEPVIRRSNGLLMVMQGAFIAFCTLGVFLFILKGLGRSEEEARTAAFVVLAGSQLFHSFNCRSQTDSIFTLGFFTNSKLVLATVFSLGLQFVVISTPVLQGFFKARPLSGIEWLLVIIVSSFPLWAMEVTKWIKRRVLAKEHGSKPENPAAHE